MTDAELTQLRTIRSNALARIAELTASLQPDQSLDGESFQWAGLLRELRATVADIDAQLVAHEPFEIESQGYLG